MKSKTTSLICAAGTESAESVGLRYVSDIGPGICRLKSGKGFGYRDASGKTIRDKPTLQRIKSLVIPPAWKDVWICPFTNGHLQATGRDDRNRKQFLYHQRWREVRDETKYNRLIDFAQALTIIRRRVQRDLAKPGLGREKVLATVVRLLEISCIRVGNEEYARDNKSYGLTTLQDRHADISGSNVRFHFRGKSGKEHDVSIQDKRLARIIKACQDLPGQELFQYVDENGERRDVQSGDVNNYLREITGCEFTAKDFRTWAGTVLAARQLQDLGAAHIQSEAKKKLSEAIKAVSQCLGNTVAVCRKCYVHPAVLDSYAAGKLAEALGNKNLKASKSLRGLRADEIAVLKLLKAALRKSKEPLEKTLKRSLKNVARKTNRLSFNANKSIPRSKRHTSA
jgi:DNA topoisomerase I